MEDVMTGLQHGEWRRNKNKVY